MNFSLYDIIAAVVSAVIGSMGLGGGGVLIMYLTLVKNTPQIYAQGMNLLFFIPCSVVSLIIYLKSGMIKPRIVAPMIAGGVVGAVIGRFILGGISSDFLKIIFSVFLIITGIFTVFSKSSTKAQ